MIVATTDDHRPRDIQVWPEDGKVTLATFESLPGEPETTLAFDAENASELLDDIAHALAELEAGER